MMNLWKRKPPPPTLTLEEQISQKLKEVAHLQKEIHQLMMQAIVAKLQNKNTTELMDHRTPRIKTEKRELI